jgi:DNA-nicking Smr family endonuclease
MPRPSDCFERWLEDYLPDHRAMKAKEAMVPLQESSDSPGWQARLDVHGLAREEALESCRGFLKECRRTGVDAALVIFGKGKHTGGPAVLRPAILALLSGHPWVREVTTAPERSGGAGACVVRFRKR